MSPRPPQRSGGFGNRAVLRLLHTPLHRLLSRHVCELDYFGRISGVRRRVPVEYVRTGDRLVVLAARAAGKRWWRNFTGAGWPLRVTLAGERYRAHAVALGPDDAGHADALSAYGTHRRPPRDDDRLVVIRLLR
ncbi:hypothetical protein GCM10010399_00400 [Dactylosporangium fulvum]|uniref:Nitroreductase family deazaflavin-dependent oxidoreductase n=1 Tax=Dactylosporangium fulvum TaxID=53359 RepID=A0ABY5VS20_9ACTN|nr:hypothetical protein [Dactylosporangium fulvum]UWP79606.1 hypothetical protein Dfulv_31130 [Dactylosporangium fulvum]